MQAREDRDGQQEDKDVCAKIGGCDADEEFLKVPASAAGDGFIEEVSDGPAGEGEEKEGYELDDGGDDGGKDDDSAEEDVMAKEAVIKRKD